MISYCIACYRPRFASMLLDELVGKTSAPYEILLWLNVEDDGFDRHIARLSAGGAPIRVVGRTPENIGMAAYLSLFAESRFDLVTQIDDDVVCISPRIAETAAAIFERFPHVGMLTADTWRDRFTCGARPPMAHYRPVDAEFGLYDGPIDGWFTVYRKAALSVRWRIWPERYMYLGAQLRQLMGQAGMHGYLCTRFRVFHATGPEYAFHFGMLNQQIAKYEEIGRYEIVDSYRKGCQSLPPPEELERCVALIKEELSRLPPCQSPWPNPTPPG